MPGPATCSPIQTSLQIWPPAAQPEDDRIDSVSGRIRPVRATPHEQAPLDAAIALYEHLTGPVAENLHRLGKPLEIPYDGVWTTRRGEYRALYVIEDSTSTITVVAVAHRRDAYRRP